MQVSMDFRSSPPAEGARPGRRNDGDYRVKLFKAASRAAHEETERAMARLRERWAAADAESAPPLRETAEDPYR
jgi:hypothetical protein